MCTFKLDVNTAAKMLRDKVNEPWQHSELRRVDGVTRPVVIINERRGGDRISLADAKAYCLDVRDNHERMEAWRRDHGDEPYPNELFSWPRSHGRKLFTVTSRGPAYCRMVECEHHMKVNMPTSREVAA